MKEEKSNLQNWWEKIFETLNRNNGGNWKRSNNKKLLNPVETDENRKYCWYAKLPNPTKCIKEEYDISS